MGPARYIGEVPCHLHITTLVLVVQVLEWIMGQSLWKGWIRDIHYDHSEMLSDDISMIANDLNCLGRVVTELANRRGIVGVADVNNGQRYPLAGNECALPAQRDSVANRGSVSVTHSDRILRLSDFEDVQCADFALLPEAPHADEKSPVTSDAHPVSAPIRNGVAPNGNWIGWIADVDDAQVTCPVHEVS